MQSKQLPITTALPQDQGVTDATSPRSGAAGGEYWRSIDELQQTPEFNEFLHREFPQAASEFPEGVSRRRWLKLMSASLAFGGLAGCRYDPGQFAAFVVKPEDYVPGVPKHYATNFELAGRAVNLLITNTDGRPTKVEGNPHHPLLKASEPNDLGSDPEKSRFTSAGTDVFSQGCILGLYDPDRLKSVMRRGGEERGESSWEEFAEYAAEHLGELAKSQGEKLAILMAPSLSPSINQGVAATVEKLPKAKVFQYSSVDESQQWSALEKAVGKPAELLYRLDAAKVICCFDSDLLGNDPNMLLYSRQFAKGREPQPEKMNRLYSVESRYSVTGAAADSRLAVRSSQIGSFLGMLERRVDELLGGANATAPAEDMEPFDRIAPEEQLQRMVDAMAEDLVAHKGAGVIAVGSHQPEAVQLAGLRLNKKLENVGQTVQAMPRRSALPDVEVETVDALVDQINSGAVDTVWILGDNPVYTTPASVELGDVLQKLEHVVYFAEYDDETAQTATWALPLAHPLESWGDVLSVDGSLGICQPQILPLLNGKTAAEILSILHANPQSGESLAKAAAEKVNGQALTSRQWRVALHDGYVEGVTAEPLSGEWKVDGDPLQGEVSLTDFEASDLEVVFSVSDTLYDGRFAKNVWMQELPQVMTKLVWDNAAIVSPATAEKLGLRQSEIVRLSSGDRSLEVPVFIMPGQAAGSITLHIGYGRVCRDEAVSSDDQVIVGHDVAPLRSLESMHVLTGVEARPTTRPYKLATTQDHFAIDSLGLDETAERARTLIREGTLEQIQKYGEEYVEHELGTHHPPLESLWEEPINTLETDEDVPYQWGMSVDLNKCTGCNACVIACQSENNIPVVGKEQVSRGREMHWIRIDRYFRGEFETPKIVNQPVACVHCETAPCEQVCPVAATVHTEEGINAMAYNRCVGTRYCANNCPYKVRRFNYFNYNTEYGYFYGWQQKGKLEEASRKLQQLVLNPEVTVRGRGVMEKCTYCIQRVQNGKINARSEGRRLEDGEVQTACQMACPTQAIVFGNINDPNSKVSQLHRDVRTYAMLAELNIKPRTMYMARVRNTHPILKTEDQLVEPSHHGGGHGHDHGHGEGEHSESQDHDHEHTESAEAHGEHS